ncbi:hypothetical protein CXB51_036356 [Gossypium anomalum]|uniref:Transmembrane protein n=1 Tax=Gossypium anomalum TaxID=47600 RepID=A0A8J5XYP1_9ROSI|nr:hypothetical protein CXB51_036356 [Gossypium anomalum]
MAANKNSHLGFSLISLIFVFSIPKSLSALDPQPAVWDMLPKYGLPSGLLPSTVTDYVLHEDGRFIVTLDSPCYVQFEYLVYYDKTITGKLGYGSITDLKGIQVKRFLFWLDVDEITVDLPPSGSIYFQVGFINKKLDVDQFQTVHSCRDGVTGSCKYSWKSVLQESGVTVNEWGWSAVGPEGFCEGSALLGLDSLVVTSSTVASDADKRYSDANYRVAASHRVLLLYVKPIGVSFYLSLVYKRNGSEVLDGCRLKKDGSGNGLPKFAISKKNVLIFEL